MAASKNPYASIVSGNVHESGPDQGIDFTGTGVVYAADQAQITRIVPSNAGWHIPGGGSELDYLLKSGPRKGQSVYVAEDFKIASGLAVGQVVPKGTTLGTFSSSWPGIETGWANATGGPLAPLPPARPASQFTPQGADFMSFARNGGAAPAATVGHFVPGVGLVDASGKTVQIDSTPIFAFPGASGSQVGQIAKVAVGAATVDALTGAGGPGSGLAKWLGIKLPDHAIQRSGEIVAGSVLLLLALGLVGYSAVSRVAAPVQPVAKATRSGVKAARAQTPGNRRARQTAANSPYSRSKEGISKKEDRTRPGFEGVGKAPRKKQAAAKRPVRRGEGIPF